MIRFQIKNPESEPFLTEWVDEITGDLSVQTAAQKVAELRREHPDGEISIERSPIIPQKKQTFVRFKIQDKSDRTLYSIPFPLSEKDAQMERLKQEYPQAEISAEEREI